MLLLKTHIIIGIVKATVGAKTVHKTSRGDASVEYFITYYPQIIHEQWTKLTTQWDDFLVFFLAIVTKSNVPFLLSL